MIILPSNPVDVAAIKAAIKEISGSFTRIEAEKDYIKDTVSELAEKYEMDKKLLNKLASAYHKSNKEEVIAEIEDFDTAYTAIFGETAI